MGATMATERLMPTGRFWLILVGIAVLGASSPRAALAVDMPDACDYDPKAGAEAKLFDVTIGGEFNSDYIYRGVTLSAHQPAMGFSLEVDRGPFYFTFNPHSVQLPTVPSADHHPRHGTDHKGAFGVACDGAKRHPRPCHHDKHSSHDKETSPEEGPDSTNIRTRTRALHVPQRADTHGLSQLITASQNRCSPTLSCPGRVVPTLLL